MDRKKLGQILITGVLASLLGGMVQAVAMAVASRIWNYSMEWSHGFFVGGLFAYFVSAAWVEYHG